VVVYVKYEKRKYPLPLSGREALLLYGFFG
jgi:hypothetical protein